MYKQKLQIINYKCNGYRIGLICNYIILSITIKLYSGFEGFRVYEKYKNKDDSNTVPIIYIVYIILHIIMIFRYTSAADE